MCRTLLRKRRGQALVEFALSGLIFFTIMFAAVQFFLIAQNKFALESGARAAIRKASIYRVDTSNGCRIAEEAAKEEFRAYMSEVSFLSDADIEKALSNAKLNCYRGDRQIGQYRIWPLEFTVRYDMDLIFPIGTTKIPLRTKVLGISEHLEKVTR